MEDRTEKRKAAFVAAASASLDELGGEMFKDALGEHEGNWLAAKVATGMLGMMALDVIDTYERLKETAGDLPEARFEARLLTEIFDSALFTSFDIFLSALPFIGKEGAELRSAAIGVLAEQIARESEDGGEPPLGWDDIPGDLLEHIAHEAGLSVEQLTDGYSFRAINLKDGTQVKRDELKDMKAEDAVVEANIRRSSDDEAEHTLDDFIMGMD